MILPVIEFRQRDRTVESCWHESGGVETLSTGETRWGGEVAGVVGGDDHGGRWAEG